MASTEQASDVALKSGIHRIPDELLSKILAFVPCPGTNVPDTSVAIKDHDSLKLVSRRFNSVMSTNSFRIEVLRCQYGTVVELHNITKIETEKEFQDIATYCTNMESLVDSMMIYGANDNMRPILREGLLILNYLKSTNTHSTNKARMISLEWAKSTVFTSQLQQILRFTLARLQDAWMDSPDDLWSGKMSDLSGRREYYARQSVGNKVLWMFKYRAFETAFLLDIRPLPMLQILSSNFVRVLAQGRAEFRTLVEICHGHANAQGNPEENPPISEAQTAKDMEYVNGYQWRLLSPRVDTVTHHTETAESSAYEDMMSTLIEELNQSEFSDIRTYLQDSSPHTRSLLIDLKVVGDFLRSAGGNTDSESTDVPEEIVQRAQEVDLLRGISDAPIELAVELAIRKDDHCFMQRVTQHMTAVDTNSENQHENPGRQESGAAEAEQGEAKYDQDARYDGDAEGREQNDDGAADDYDDCEEDWEDCEDSEEE